MGGGRYFIRRIFASIALRLLQLAEEKREVAFIAANLKRDLREGVSVRSGYVDHYDEQSELDVWMRYQAVYSAESSTSSEVVYRAEYMRDVIIGLITKNPNIKSVINIGCSYGWLENEIARRFPAVRVYGIDRCERAMELNRKELPIDNLEFISGDFDSITKQRPETLDHAIVCHVNFGCYFLPKGLADIYQKSFDGGATNIVVFEPSGISRHMHKYYHYTLDQQDPWVFRGPMLLNNYPALLNESGFNIVYSQKLKPPHPHPDFRSVCFVAERRAL